MGERTPTFLFESDDMDFLNREITSKIMKEGKDITFGYERKEARETCMLIHLFGKAVAQLTNGKTPQGYVFGGEKLQLFRQMGIADDVNPSGHAYTYQQMLREFPDGPRQFDQLENARKLIATCIEEDRFENGIVGVLYHPDQWDAKERPCWNWVQFLYMGNGEISLRLVFRSHDYGTALWANLSFILYMIRHFVASPNDCKVTEVILLSTSAHIYEGDSQIAERITGHSWDDREPEKETLRQKIGKWLLK